MGKHKIIKSAAAVALTASVVATAAPGASAASYKTNAKDQLVHTSTGKLVKGWKVFGGKLYKNGKLAPAKKYKIIGTGAAQKLFYGPTLKKGYKTANSKTLLFKDGKLADGWKQAGKNERLYKNGKLDKGYTVYTNVEGDKFLYQNGKLKKGQKTATRGGETLLFVDGKLAKGYVLHEASKTLFNNGKVAEGLVKYPETDGKFYNDGKLANGEINGAEYKDGVLVAKDIASVKAINGTTVEVTFKEAQKADDVKAADYKIEGLEVKNAAVKQTDSKVVVLTTSAQEAAKEYTLVYKEADTKTFTGVSAVIPTSVKITKGSQQGVIGKEVTVEAQVTVAEGQSKAGIPVTIVVDSNKDSNGSNSDNNIAKDYKVEVYTDENGVAKYSYTQYASNSEDTVTAYPTGDASVKSLAGIVYWGQAQRLALTEVTEGNTLANQAKKVYKIASPELKDGYVFVAFKENVDVTPDKVVKGASVVETTTLSGSSSYPYQVTTGGKQYVAVKLDSKGEATFTVTGTETTVTPIVFSDKQFNTGTNNIVDKDDKAKLDVTELQAAAPAVTFGKSFTNQLEVAATGTQNAAYGTVTQGTNLFTTSNVGGRIYTATVKTADGKIAPAGTKVKVAFKKGDFSTDKAVYAQGNSESTATLINSTSVVIDAEVKGNEGKATFKVAGVKDAFAKPTVFFDNGQPFQPGLDDADLQVTGEFTYFVNAVVKNASLTTNAAHNNNKVTADKPVTFTYTALDQNDQAYEVAGTTQFQTSFQVAATNSDVVVYKVDGTTALGTVKAGTTETFKVDSTDRTTAQIVVKTKDLVSPAVVNVQASASQVSLPNKSVSVEFTKVTTAVENAVAKINAAKGYVNDKDLYNTAARVTTVNDTNLAAVKDAVAVAYTNNGGDLTQEKIEKAVKDAVAAKAKADAKVKAEDAVAKAKTTPTQANVNDAQTAVDAAKAAGNDTTALQAEVDAVQITVNENTGKAVAFGTTETQALTNASGVWADLATKLAETTATVKQTDTTVKVKGTGTLSQSSAYPTVTGGHLYVGITFTAPKGFTATEYTLGNGNKSNVDGTNQAFVTVAFTKAELDAVATTPTKTLKITWTATDNTTKVVEYTIDYSELAVK